MSGPERDPSIHSEPHLKEHSFKPDPSEEVAAKRLAQERMARDPSQERAEHSVFDEPAALPNRPPALIDRDWFCRNCGYNLRGLMTGHRCPECGLIERYEPPREGEESYAKWLADYRKQPKSGESWLIAMLLPWLGAPFAAITTLVLVEKAGFVAFCVLGPAAAEVAKVIAAAMLIERSPHRVGRPAHLYVMMLGTAAVFAVVQNVLYLTMYLPGAATEVVAWRWTFCIAAHVLCTLIVACALVRTWGRAREEQRPPDITRAYGLLGMAILLHAACNCLTFFQGYSGYGF